MTGIIILAAGASSRLGRPKQTLNYKEKTLLKHSIDSAVNVAAGPVIVVIGANEKEIRNHVESEPVIVVLNKNWNDGIASSINKGLTYIIENKKEVDNIILMVCDQPYVDEKLLKLLIDTRQTTHHPIAACSYNNTIGVPALFDKMFFTELLSLKEDEGGKKILYKNQSSVAAVLFPDGSIDIDTVDDYKSLEDLDKI